MLFSRARGFGLALTSGFPPGASDGEVLVFLLQKAVTPYWVFQWMLRNQVHKSSRCSLSFACGFLQKSAPHTYMSWFQCCLAVLHEILKRCYEATKQLA